MYPHLHFIDRKKLAVIPNMGIASYNSAVFRLFEYVLRLIKIAATAAKENQNPIDKIAIGSKIKITIKAKPNTSKDR